MDLEIAWAAVYFLHKGQLKSVLTKERKYSLEKKLSSLTIPVQSLVDTLEPVQIRDDAYKNPAYAQA